MSNKSRGIRKPTQEIVMDWFEANPASHVRSGPLAKALKMTPTTIADALGKLAAMGKLHREKKAVAGEERARARAEQWEYSLPSINTVAQRREPKAFKPLKTATGYRRVSAIEQAPSIIAPTLRQPQPDVGQNTGSLGSDRHLRADSLPEAQAVAQPPKPDETPVEAGGDVTAEAAPITHHCTGDRCQSRQQCLRYTTRHKPARPVFAAFWARREAGASACDSFLPLVQVEGAV